jgi:hypothetical protein
MFVASVFAKSALKGLLQKIDGSIASQTGKPNYVKIVVYVDEAHTLTDNETPRNADNNGQNPVKLAKWTPCKPYHGNLFRPRAKLAHKAFYPQT